MRIFRRLFRSTQITPLEHQHNFRQWYMDVVWWGVLNGSTLVFLSIFCARQGASVQQLGLLSAAPALVNLVFTFPAGNLMKRLPTWKAACWPYLLTRVFYLFFIPLPLLFTPQLQVWIIIILSFVMNIPGTVAAVAGNAYFAETVPDEYRGQVVATRMAILSASTMLTSLIVGQALDRIPFPNGYIVVFLLGFIGSALSTYHLFNIRPASRTALAVMQAPAGSSAAAQAGVKSAGAASTNEAKSGPRTGTLHFIQARGQQMRPELLAGRYGVVLLLLFFFQFASCIGNPVFPAYQVDSLKMSDNLISLGTCVFWIFHFVGATQAGGLARRWGFKKLTGVGIVLTCLSTVVFTFSYHFWIFAITQTISGFGWSLINTGVVNYLLSNVPAGDRPAHLAWYNIAVNVAVLLASLLAPDLVSVTGLMVAMLVVAGMRLLAGVSILKWG
jgi:MFS family permease